MWKKKTLGVGKEKLNPALDVAVAVFRIANPNLEYSATIKPQILNLESKYFEKDLERSDRENDHSFFVQRQKGFRHDPTLTKEQIYKKEKRVDAKVLYEMVKDPFKTDTEYYYYVIYRSPDQISPNWSAHLDPIVKKRYRYGVPGFRLPVYILEHVQRFQAQMFSELVLATPEHQLPGGGKGLVLRFYHAPMNTLIQIYEKDHKKAKFINSSGQLLTGFAMDQEVMKKIEI